MVSTICTPEMKLYLEQNIAKYQIQPTGKYIIQEYKHPKFNIKIYTTNTILIAGEKKQAIYQKLFEHITEDKKIGYDEVGVGDFFGPTVYCAVKLEKDSIKELGKLCLPIKDSKKLTDQEMANIYRQVRKIINYSIQVVYDRDIDSKLSSVDQKLYYHHQNYQKLDQADYISIIDLFTTEKNFYSKSQKLNIKWKDSLVIETKADDRYICVALASIIARHYFLGEMAMLRVKYNFNLPLGANVKLKAQEFVDQNSKEVLSQFAKTSFKTFNEIKK